MKTKILVIYVGIAGMRSEDVQEYVYKVAAKITPTTFEGEVIVLPTQSLPMLETRVDCINPSYITEPELIQQHTEKMKKLQEELKIQLELIKEKNNE
jgi:hypothetical protein